jgi:PPK2 family polyphosphate:nucleotide phosphotransferase
MFEQLRVKAGDKVRIDDFDAGSTPGFKGGKARSRTVLQRLSVRLETLQAMLWAEHRRKVLVVLQGMDTSGKDGTISHVFEGVNPLGVNVAAWKAPSDEEKAHDFLWRIHRRVPGAGEIMIFNRSHYEDVLTARVHDLVPAAAWRARYDQINRFEQLLSESDTTVLKFFLHISRDEQKKRLLARLDDPAKRWKLRRSDIEDRRLWPDFMNAYEDVLNRTSTRHAPWWVVPADKKWFRNVVVATTLVRTLERLKLRLPEPAEDLSAMEIV